MAGISFSGPYQSWDLASSQSLGYDKEEILEKTLNTVLKVKSGELAYERDSVGFEKPSFNWPLLAALREEALRSNSHLHVIDFGGSLGSAYFQHLSMLSLCNLKWNIIERKQIVDAGQKHLADETLGFFESLLSFATNWGRLTSFFFPAFCNTCGNQKSLLIRCFN